VVPQVYAKYLADPKPENMPILEDLYRALLVQDEREAKRIATALEIYVTGSLNVFNHRTNVVCCRGCKWTYYKTKAVTPLAA